MTLIPTGNPLEPCPFDEDGVHEWLQVNQSGSGDPLPGARLCQACQAFDAGPYGLRVSYRDSAIPLFPAATRSYRQIESHNPDLLGVDATPGEETN